MTQVVLITGAGGGIGKATAIAFAELGWRLVLSDVDESSLAATVQALPAGTVDTLTLVGDLGAPDFLKQLVETSLLKFGRVDVLINNAAWRTVGSLRSMEMEVWNRTLQICLTAPVFLTKWVAESMEKNGIEGVIVNVTSMMADRPAGTSPGYIAAKGALESLTKELAVTYGRSGIRVVAVAPGYIETEMSNDYVDESGQNISNTLIQNLTDSIPLARGGSSREVARALVWVSSAAASYITGTTLVVDGGLKGNFSSYSQKNLQFPNEF